MNDSLRDLGVNLQLLQDENKGLNTVVTNYEREQSAMKTGFQNFSYLTKGCSKYSVIFSLIIPFPLQENQQF